MHRCVAFSLSAMIGLAGCASPYNDGTLALQQGDLTLAEQQLRLTAQEGNGAAWNNLALVYEGQGRTQAAIDAYRMGARYGDPTARSNLAQKKMPIPAADLVGRSPFVAPATVSHIKGLDQGH